MALVLLLLGFFSGAAAYDSCQAGTYYVASGGCGRCDAGFYCAGGWMGVFNKMCWEPQWSTRCGCPAGSTSRAGAKGLANCYCTRAGYALSGSACAACARGTYSKLACVNPGLWYVDQWCTQECAACPASAPCTLYNGSSSVAQCVNKCPGGTYMGGVINNASVCVGCAAGTFSAGGCSAACSACGAGTYSSAANASECTSCPAGTYSTGSGATDASGCVPCAAGSYATNGTCVKCGAGTVAADAGASSCTACAAGTFALNSTYCAACPPFYMSGAGASACSKCSPGYSGAGCAPCPANTFNALVNGTCVKCAAGTTSAAGASVCAVCPTGTYSPVAGEPCVACNASFAARASCKITFTKFFTMFQTYNGIIGALDNQTIAINIHNTCTWSLGGLCMGFPAFTAAAQFAPGYYQGTVNVNVSYDAAKPLIRNVVTAIRCPENRTCSGYGLLE